jgi:hypothetical protein
MDVATLAELRFTSTTRPPATCSSASPSSSLSVGDPGTALYASRGGLGKWVKTTGLFPVDGDDVPELHDIEDVTAGELEQRGWKGLATRATTARSGAEGS